ncbi:MAG: 3-phosphoglycerate dehydrogenase [Candidatus Micrarchaeota archaeon]|nr:3-phosphoglycerate dehydrogenase [Candidatus Micrarchaeota archaeon]MDE1834680.1 3-phosphoglycerate dehydrogenase [Candidatus Micrarchaeota archaeon]MDE1859139.1 3-phosphoglycerate dehydrogenase [Candidatus Micrarchaeota archaeon]
MNIVIPDQISLKPKHFEIIKSLGNVKIYDDIPNEAELIKRIKDAELITANWVEITPKIIDNAPRLKFIVAPAVGYEWIASEYAAKKGIKVLNCPTHNAAAVANLTIAFILAITRRLKEANRSVEEGKWIRRFKGVELEGKTLGLIGYGNSGKIVGEVAKLLGMKVKYANTKTPKEEVDEIIKTSDIISLHTPLTKDTKHLIDEHRIKMMKKGVYFINVSRGGVVDQKALIKALKSGHIAGAALDVFENESIKELDSGIDKEIIELAKMSNVITTPHMAYNTNEMFERMGEEIILNIKSCINGKPINVVN